MSFVRALTAVRRLKKQVASFPLSGTPIDITYRWHRRISVLPILIALAGPVGAFEIGPYFESANDKPKGGFGISFQETALRLKAGLNVEIKNGKTRTLPQISSSYSFGKKFTIENSINLPDWNSGVDLSHATLDTKLRINSPVPFVSRMNMRVRHLANGIAHDTTMNFRSPVSFFNQVQGKFSQLPNGMSRTSLKFGFSQRLSAPGAELPFTINGRTTLETMSRPRRPDTAILGMETTISGLIPRFLNGLSRCGRSYPPRLSLVFYVLPDGYAHYVSLRSFLLPPLKT